MCHQPHYFERIVVEMNHVSSIILKLIDEQLQIEFKLIKTRKTNSSFSHKVIYSFYKNGQYYLSWHKRLILVTSLNSMDLILIYKNTNLL
jgi:hypothetical protein